MSFDIFIIAFLGLLNMSHILTSLEQHLWLNSSTLDVVIGDTDNYNWWDMIEVELLCINLFLLNIFLNKK